jgi:hypothetical protein
LTEKHLTADKAPKEETMHQAPILNLLIKSKKPDEVYALIGDLRHHFPFLRYKDVLNEKAKVSVSADSIQNLALVLRGGTAPQEKKPEELQPEEYTQLLKSLLEWMNSLRNCFSHYKTTPKFKFDKADTFYQIYDAALFRLIDKNKQTKRYDYFNQKDIEHLERKPKAIKEERVPHKISATAIDEKTLAYFICLFLEPKYASIFLSRLAGFQKALTVDKMSMAEKAQLKAYTMFCCRLPQPKLESSDIMLDMLNELNRCPNDLYNVLSEADKDRRFKVDLTAEAALAIAQNQNIPINNDEDGEYTEGVPQEVILKRHDDRFPYFALRYFDDTNAFKTLRFHVQLGKLLKKDKYDKVMYGEKRERELTQPIFTFSKLKPMRDKYDMVNQDDLENKKIDARFVSKFNETWTEEKDGQTQLKAVIEQFSPHYNFGEQTIGFKIFDKESQANEKDNNLPRLPNLNETKKVKGIEPDAFISTYELRNLFFYQYLYKARTIETSAEDFIKIYIANIQRFFKDVKDGAFKPITEPPDFTKNERKPYVKDKWERKVLLMEYDERQVNMEERRKLMTARIKETYNIGKTSVPHDIWEYLLGYKMVPYGEYVTQKLLAQHKDIKQRLKDLEKDRAPRVGEQATWIAEDILHFMPARTHIVNDKPHDQKMNNDQFRILQSSLAYFSSNKDDIWMYFKEMGLIHSPVPDMQHPFLQKIGKGECRSLMDFYKKYLVAKDDFLGEVVKFVCGDLDKPKYANPDLIKAKYGYFLPKPEKKGMSKSYEGIPVLLPKGLFNEAISMALNKAKKSGYKGEINTVVYSLEQYVNGDTQDFYDYEHFARMPKVDENTEGVLRLKTEYVAELESKITELDIEKEKAIKQKAINDKQRKTKDEKLQELKDELRNNHRLKNRILDREQTIRYHQANDRALWLMIKDRQDKADEHLDFDLTDLKLANIEAILNEFTEVKGSVPRIAPIVAGELPRAEVKVVEQLPIRRYGDLRRVLKDRRLENLVAYYFPPQEEDETEERPIYKIEHETIKKDLEQYDLRRSNFFALIHTFEETVYKYYGSEFPRMVNGKFDNRAFMHNYGKVVKDHEKELDYYPHHVFMGIASDHLEDRELAEHYHTNVIQLRNKFVHNEIPYFPWLTKEVENESKSVYICDNIFEVAERYYKELLKMIKPTEERINKTIVIARHEAIC